MTNEESKMEVIELEVTDAPDLKFTGVCLGWARDFPDREHEHFSGTVGHWSSFTIYKTAKGKYVGYKEKLSLYTESMDINYVKISETANGLESFFGYCDGAKRLYAIAGIDTTVDPDDQ